MENIKALYRIGLEPMTYAYFLGRLKSVTLPGPFDSIHELAHYEFTAFAFINR